MRRSSSMLSSSNTPSWRSITSRYRGRQGSLTAQGYQRVSRVQPVPTTPPRLTLQIRTWNIAHGVDVPPREGGYGHMRRKLLREMAGLMVEGAPDLILLQEVPVWAGPLLREATGMGVTLAPVYGAHVPFLHVPLPLALGSWLGNAMPDVVRTQFEGQANAILY